jgi:hemerythrin
MIPYVVWKDFYTVGDPSLDAQHKQILAAVNALYEAMQHGKDRAALRSILDMLVQYTLVHFADEERLMQEHGYPHVAEHAALHEELRRRTLDWREHIDLATGREVLRFLKEWWLGHIQGADKKYAPYMAGKGNIHLLSPTP